MQNRCPSSSKLAQEDAEHAPRQSWYLGEVTVTQAGAEVKGRLGYVQQFLWPTVAFRVLYQEQLATLYC